MRSYLEILIELKEVLDSDMEMPRVFKKRDLRQYRNFMNY